jgi:hypothetical protein
MMCAYHPDHERECTSLSVAASPKVVGGDRLDLGFAEPPHNPHLTQIRFDISIADT